MKNQSRYISIGVAVLSVALVALAFNLTIPARTSRLDPSRIEEGAALFSQNCAVCHGQNAEATSDWKKTDSNGIYPPPPLNGSAHAWHHSYDVLKQTIEEGGAKYGGVMPAFGDQLFDQEIDALIAFFQSKWPDDVYRKWVEQFGSD